MKKVIMNTVPFGLVTVATASAFIVTFVTVMIIFPETQWYMLAGICVSGKALIYIVKIKLYFNFVMVSDDYVWHKRVKYSWNEVYVTMHMVSHGNTTPDCLYFSSDYLSQSDIKENKHKNFCILVTRKRLEHILPKYPKRVEVLKTNRWSKKVLQIVQEHNKKIENGKNV